MGSYRICRVSLTRYYEGQDAILQAAGPAGASYDQMRAALFANEFLFSDAFCRAMRALGNDCHELLGASFRVQAQWAAEHGFDASGPDGLRRVLAAQIDAIRPDILYIQGGISLGLLDHDIKARFPSVRKIIVYSGTNIDEHLLKNLDLFYGCWPGLANAVRKMGAASEVLYHAFPSGVDGKLAALPAEPRIPCSFVGSTGFPTARMPVHVERYFNLIHLMCMTDLEIWAHEYRDSFPELDPAQRAALDKTIRWVKRLPNPRQRHQVILDFLERTIGLEAAELPLRFLFPDRVHEPVFGLGMYDLLRRTDVSVNLHINLVHPYVGNMRLFEATGAGSCMIVENGDNIRELFEPDQEVVTFSSMSECARKVRDLLDHPEETRRIAAAGQRRTLADHTTEQRVRRIHEKITDMLR